MRSTLCLQSETPRYWSLFKFIGKYYVYHMTLDKIEHKKSCVYNLTTGDMYIMPKAMLDNVHKIEYSFN